MFFIAWQGLGVLLPLVFIGSAAITNFDAIFLNNTEFGKLNYNPPYFMTAIFTIWLDWFLKRASSKYANSPYMQRLFNFVGVRHTFFWVPLLPWAVILFGIGVYQLFR
jgi:hypothetical protein